MTEDDAIEVDENGTTSIDGVFAGGDITQGMTTVIVAMIAEHSGGRYYSMEELSAEGISSVAALERDNFLGTVR